MPYELGFIPLNDDVSASVNSVFGRTGAIAASVGDYTAAQVTNAADKSSAATQVFTGSITAPTATITTASVGTLVITSQVGSQFYSLGVGEAAGSVSGTFSTNQPASASVSAAVASTLVLGTPFQNKLSYDITMTIFLSVTVNTSGVISLGVGPISPPPTNVIVSGVTTVGFLPIKFKIPSGEYALLSISGTVTDSISGQFVEAA